ncbi:MAG: methionyl-tRNA formyltransferase [Candidatus Neomarinimicrobiota bacterium]|nr:methionyl-tRNA formyltransferase [Candidatus Neomarinimicrobiota bacterium]
MNIIFMTNSEFSFPSLEILMKSDHNILSLVTNPPEEIGRKKKIISNTIILKCEELGIHTIKQKDLNDISFENKLTRYESDLFVIVAYRILPKSLLSIPKLGSINLHGSLLPAYRGAAPIQWSLINGDKQTGLSTFFVEPQVDTGAIINQKKINIIENENYGSLRKRMAIKGSKLLLDTISLISDGKISPVKQDKNFVTTAPKITKKMTFIDWNSSSIGIHNFVRGLTPIPGAQSRINGKKIKIQETVIINNNIHKLVFAPGQVVDVSKNELFVQTGNGILSIIRLQLEGKKSLDIKSFLNGYSLKIGDSFGT